MSVAIPDRNDTSFSSLLEALDNVLEDQNIVLMDLMKVEDKDSDKTVQIALKVFVPQIKRTTTRDMVASYLNNKLDKGIDVGIEEVKVGTNSNPYKEQLDLVIRKIGKKSQVIRVEIKPTNSGGSGGGTAATTIQESGMALFAAIRYLKNKDLECHPERPEDCLTDDDYIEGMKHVDAPGVTIEEIKSLPSFWKNSFILGANTIYKNIKGSGWEFLRGDDLIEKEISNRFKKVVKIDKQANLAQEDKWNPSDIWMIKKSEKTNILNLLKQENTVDCLNNFLQMTFSDEPIIVKSGKSVPRKSLIGISLKKLGGTVRFKEQNKIGVNRLKKVEGILFKKRETLARLKAFTSIDVYFNYGPSNFDSFQARNFAGGNKGDWKLELKGEFAAMGKVQGSVVRDLLKRAKFNNIPNEPDFIDCKQVSGKKEESITNEIYKLLDKFSPSDFKGTEDELKQVIRDKGASYRYSKLSGLRLLDWFVSLTVSESNRAMKELYLYASSQSDKSSVYYKMF
tara:strand:+ start:51 stop:1580 length:1530 start_codon:yes stop_codon:yes gene_type:complete